MASSADYQSDINYQFQKSKEEEYQLDLTYNGGSYLIYDCFGSHYACVNEDSYKKCQTFHDEDDTKDKKNYRCAPLKKFSTKKECVLNNYDLQERKILRNFCFRKVK